MGWDGVYWYRQEVTTEYYCPSIGGAGAVHHVGGVVEAERSVDGPTDRPPTMFPRRLMPSYSDGGVCSHLPSLHNVTHCQEYGYRTRAHPTGPPEKLFRGGGRGGGGGALCPMDRVSIGRWSIV